MRKRLLASGAAGALAVSALTGLLSPGAQADTGLVARYPAGAVGTWFSGLAFDACAAPSRTTMNAWRASPYKAIGIYISGGHRACRQDHLSAGWIRDVAAMGWKFLPLDVGLQSPCADNPRLRRMSSTPSMARDQGTAAAERSLAAAADLGILPGSALYSDIEPYNPRDVGCGNAVRAYVSAWTRTLHAAGYLSGVYSTLGSGIRGLSTTYGSESYSRPDAVWSAHWDRRTSLRGWSGVPNDHWPAHQRVKQYRGDHDETHGGVRVNIDSNAVDAPVATVAQHLRLSAGAGVQARRLPHPAGAIASTFRADRTVPVVCRATTSLGRWARLADGTYLPDAALSGSGKSWLPECAVPYQVTSHLNQRAAPTVASALRGSTPAGALAWVRCASPGITLGRDGFWYLLENGRWVSGAFLATPDRYRRPAGVPLCSASPAPAAATPDTSGGTVVVTAG